jgi:uncharacterized protein (TIGR00251 family)
MSTPSFLRPHADGVLLALKVQPRASQNEIGEALGDELRVRVTAPPVDDAANEAVVRFLADKLGCGRNKVELVRGHASRHKVVKLHGFTEPEVMKAIGARIQ